MTLYITHCITDATSTSCLFIRSALNRTTFDPVNHPPHHSRHLHLPPLHQVSPEQENHGTMTLSITHRITAATSTSRLIIRSALNRRTFDPVHHPLHHRCHLHLLPLHQVSPEQENI